MATQALPEVLAQVQELALRYKEYIIHLGATHVVIETALIIVILYILIFKRSYDPKKRGYGARGVASLSQKEQDELIADWEPEPLVSQPKGLAVTTAESPEFVIEAYLPGQNNTVVKVVGDDRPKLSFCARDFLGLSAHNDVHTKAISTIEEYSVGSCGPRGFYGSTRPHLTLEDAIAAFMGVPESISYSDEVATIASCIPAFAKRGDLLVVDSGVNHAVHVGCKLSRSKLLYFKHNDVEDLERVLKAVKAHDKSKGDTSLSQRRFVVIEGLYADRGDIAPLRDIVRIARQHCFRIIVDDSLGIGTLGATGRGTLEHHGLTVSDVDLLVGSLGNTFGAVGGFCVGSRDAVDHQRLSGAGYCFSASAPPYLCATAEKSLRLMLDEPARLQHLQEKATYLHDLLAQQLAPYMRVVSIPSSPFKVLTLAVGPGAGQPYSLADAALAERATCNKSLTTPVTLPLPFALPLGQARVQEETLLRNIVLRAKEHGVLVARTHAVPSEALAPRPALRLNVSVAHSEKDFATLVAALAQAAAEVLANLPAAAPVAAPEASAAAAASEESSPSDAADGVRHRITRRQSRSEQ